MVAHEFHVPATAGLPSLPATAHKTSVLLQRSDCDWVGVSLNVTEILIFDCQSSLGKLSSHVYKESFEALFDTLF